MILSELSFNLMRALGIFSFMITALCIFGLVRLTSSKLGRLGAMIYSLCILISLSLCVYFGAAVDNAEHGGYIASYIYLFGKTPVWLFVILLAAAAAGAVAVTFAVSVKIKNSLTPTSLLEGLDGMPDGICYSDENGASVLINRRMQHIINTVFGPDFTGMEQLKNIDKEKLQDGCKAGRQGDGLFLMLSDGTVYDLRTDSVSYGKEKFDECIAYDVTEQYKKSLEMRRRNEHLAQVNGKIREYSKSMDKIIREKELLDAKIRIHDDMGRALLSLRSYLSRQERDREALTTLWRVTVSVLRCETVPDVSSDRMSALSDAAEAVGVKLYFDGEIPDNSAAEEISAAAVRECLTNTVKHADGSNLYIKTQTVNGCFIIKIKNDGRPPEKPIVETGGLRTLRKSVEQHGGEMNTEWKNGFVLTIKLYGGEGR